jgi:hypothetical protein
MEMGAREASLASVFTSSLSFRIDEAGRSAASGKAVDEGLGCEDPGATGVDELSIGV